MKKGMRIYFMRSLYGEAMKGTITRVEVSKHCMDKGRLLVTAKLDNGQTVTDYAELFSRT